MNKEEFQKMEYKTLREEITNTKSRIFKLVGYGIVVVPSAHLLARTYRLDILLISIPILVIVVALFYLAESRALMRCGTYIKFHIESRIDGVVGWEHWLEQPGSTKRRSVDNFVGYSFYLLFLVYYAGSVYLAIQHAMGCYSMICATILLAVYVAIGVWFLIFLISQHRLSTTTDLKDA
nr:hypothetical protein [candidate division Zixibacteria bacterium]